MADLSEKLKSVSVLFTGNRLTLAGYVFCLAGIIAPYSINEDSTFTAKLSRNLGFFLLLSTSFGTQSLIHYKKAKKHIQENNGFDNRYLKTALDTDIYCLNYCPEQGIYLAAKETGHLAAFEEARKKYSKNIIPHF